MNKNNIVPSSAEATNAIEPQGPLTPKEQKVFADCAQQIALLTMFATGALRIIWDKKLYRTEFQRWDDYVIDRWSQRVSFAHQLLFLNLMYAMKLERRVAIVPFVTMPKSKRQMRLLATLGECNKIIAAWMAILERTAGASPSLEVVAEVVQEMQQTERELQTVRARTEQEPGTAVLAETVTNT